LGWLRVISGVDRSGRFVETLEHVMGRSEDVTCSDNACTLGAGKLGDDCLGEGCSIVNSCGSVAAAVVYGRE